MVGVKKKFKIYLSLGSNLGERIENIEMAIAQINKEIGKVKTISSYYETESWGFESKNSFINIVLLAETQLNPFEALEASHNIENEIGRDRTVIKAHEMDYFDRVIDIDIIDFEGERINTEKLTVPHSKFQKRKFVLIPLREVDPKYSHPATNQGIDDLIENCNDNSAIRKIES